MTTIIIKEGAVPAAEKIEQHGIKVGELVDSVFIVLDRMKEARAVDDFVRTNSLSNSLDDLDEALREELKEIKGLVRVERG
jgi:hypothetical protein